MRREAPDRPHRWRTAAAGVALASVAFGIFLFLNPAGATASTWVDDLGSLLAAGFATFGSSFKAFSSRGRERSGWTWVAIAAGSWTIGEAIWSWYAVVLAEPVPSPSVADIAYLLGVPFAVIGIALLSSRRGEHGHIFRQFLDGCIIAGSLMFISWATALGVVYRVSGVALLPRLVDLAYPVTDIMLATAALAALSRVTGSRRRELALIGVALVAFAFSDSAFTYLTQTGTYGGATVLDTGYVLGYLLIFLAALIPTSSDESAVTPVTTAQSALPYVPLGIAVCVTIVKASTGGDFDALLVATGIVTISLVLIRQLITLVENHRLAEGLRQTISQLRDREAELAHQASHDPLTGLANRVLFADRVAHALDRQQRNGGYVAVMICDLDEFKSVNDTLGHHAGDVVLRSIAEQLVGCTRRSDTIARLGGDEFGILLEDLQLPDGALETARRINEGVRSPILVSDERVTTTVSIGLALSKRAVSTPESLLKEADIALYDAKEAGRDQYRVFNAERLHEVFARLELRGELAGLASDPQQLVVHYQPIVDLASGEVRALEALVRWQHPTKGMLGPDEFIARAEESGVIVAIGEAVLDRACAELAALWSEGVTCPSISVNLSAGQLKDPGLPDMVRRCLEKHRIAPGRLTLEVAERVLLQEADQAAARLHELKQLGVEIALDNFGSGNSSLQCLQSLPIDIVKIDRTFIAGLEGGASVLVDLMNQFAHAVGLRTVVGGIETPSQMEICRELSCDDAQGFLIARPCSPGDLRAVFGRQCALRAERTATRAAVSGLSSGDETIPVPEAMARPPSSSAPPSSPVSSQPPLPDQHPAAHDQPVMTSHG